jgi:hypothetical protein
MERTSHLLVEEGQGRQVARRDLAEEDLDYMEHQDIGQRQVSKTKGMKRGSEVDGEGIRYRAQEKRFTQKRPGVAVLAGPAGPPHGAAAALLPKNAILRYLKGSWCSTMLNVQRD